MDWPSRRCPARAAALRPTASRESRRWLPIPDREVHVPRSRSGLEAEARSADAHLVAGPQRRIGDARAIDEGAVRRTLVADNKTALRRGDHRVATRDGGVHRE